MAARVETGSADRAHPWRLVVTGISGQLGRHLLKEIRACPNTRVFGLLRACETPPPELDPADCVRVDFQELNTVAATVQRLQPTALIHCAATGMQQPRPSWTELVAVNVTLSAQLCELAARVPGCHFVFVSSGLAYREQGRPLREDDPLDSRHPYAATKAAADQLVQAIAADTGVPLTVVRPFLFSGAGDAGTRLFPALLRAAAERQPFALSAGDQIRDHCAVNDIAHGIALALVKRAGLPSGTHVFNLGSGAATSLRALLEGVVAELGLEVTLQFGARDYAPFEPRHCVADITRARQLLGWQPRTNFAYALWELAQESFPTLRLKQPRRSP